MQPTSDHTGHSPSISDSPDLSKLSLGLSETSSDLSQKNNNTNKDISNEISPEILKKHSLITRNLQEIIDPNNLLLQKLQNKEMIEIYWGTATTGRPHLAYFLPLLKLKDFLDTKSCSIKILLADIHAMLDNLKSTAELIELRTVYYKKLLTVLLGILKVDVSVSATNSTSNIEFITGSSFQTSSAYVMDLYKLSTLTTERSAKKAGSEVVKQTTNTLLSSMLYPLMQALDEEYLKVDVQFGGIDQRKIFTYARGYLGRIGFKPRVHLMNPIIQSLTAAACGNNNATTNVDLESKPKPINKMSASDINSKIDLLDSPSQVKRKVNKAYQEEKNPNSGLMEVLNLILFPVCKIQNIPIIFNINNTLKEYKEYKEVEEALTRGELHPGDLKQGIITALNKILDLVRVGMLGSEELIKAAYK